MDCRTDIDARMEILIVKVEVFLYKYDDDTGGAATAGVFLWQN